MSGATCAILMPEPLRCCGWTEVSPFALAQAIRSAPTDIPAVKEAGEASLVTARIVQSSERANTPTTGCRFTQQSPIMREAWSSVRRREFEECDNANCLLVPSRRRPPRYDTWLSDRAPSIRRPSLRKWLQAQRAT